MVYGRPIRIPYKHASKSEDSLFELIDDELFVRVLPQPADVPAHNAFFLHAVRLDSVMDQVVERLCKAKFVLKSDLDGHARYANMWPHVVRGSHPITLLTVIIQLDSILLN